MTSKKVSQYAVAEALGMSQPAVWRRLSGDVEFTVPQLRTVATLLKVPLAELLAASDAAA